MRKTVQHGHRDCGTSMLRDEDQYLNADKFPCDPASDRKKIVKDGPAASAAEGELTLKGISKPVQIPFYHLVPSGGKCRGLQRGIQL